jgi:hypothetical protein
MFVNRSGQNEQSLERTFHRCFLPSFSSFGWEVSEEKIKMWKVNGRRTPSDGKSSHCLWQGELIKKCQPNAVVFVYKLVKYMYQYAMTFIIILYQVSNFSSLSCWEHMPACTKPTYRASYLTEVTGCSSSITPPGHVILTPTIYTCNSIMFNVWQRTNWFDSTRAHSQVS